MLERFRTKRGRIVALALLPFAAFGTAQAMAATGTTPISTGDDTGSQAREHTRLWVGTKHHHTKVGKKIVVRGIVNPYTAHRAVTIKADNKKLKKVRTRKGGHFRFVWHPGHAGVFKVSAKVQGNEGATRAHRRAKGRIFVYRPALASYYGPGLYGGGLACGGTLRPGTLGVANKTLPCGTKVSLRHGHRHVTVRVIDRGPYAAGREFDLTEATKNRIGFGSTGIVYSTR